MKYIIFSALAHIFLFLLSIKIIASTVPDLTRTFIMDNAVAATLVTTNSERKVETKIKTTIPKTKKISSQRTLGIAKAQHNTKTLLTILHTAIAKYQNYPESAEALQQNGKVSIGFIASPTGQLSYVHIIQSSENSSIDQAAIAAVMQASPIPELAQYLKKRETFTIDILFD